MKIVRWAAFLGLLILTANIALADSVGDPKWQTIGGGGSTILNSPTDQAFQVNYTAGVTPLVSCAPGGLSTATTCIQDDFINNSGVIWSGISFVITSVGGSITQDSFSVDNTNDPYFAMAALTFNDAGQAVLSFFGIDATHPGILPTFPGTCTDGPSTCQGPFINEITPGYDFGILVNVSDALNPGDSFTAQGTAAVPEPKSIVLMLVGVVLVGLFLSKKAVA